MYFSREMRRLCRRSLNFAPAVLSAAVVGGDVMLLHEGGERPHPFRCCRNVFSSSRFSTLIGKFELNGLVHVYFISMRIVSGKTWQGSFRTRKDSWVYTNRMGHHRLYVPVQAVCFCLASSVQPSPSRELSFFPVQSVTHLHENFINMKFGYLCSRPLTTYNLHIRTFMC